MSGLKNTSITVNQSSYTQLRNNARRLDNENSNIRKSLKQQEKKFGQLKKDESRARAKMQREYRSGLNRLSADMRESEIRQNNKIEALRSDLKNDLQAHKRAVAKAFNEHRAAVDRRISTLENTLKAEKDSQRRFAKQMIDDVSGLADTLVKGIRHEKFAPGKLSNIRQRINVLTTDFNSENYQACIASARERHYELQDLHQEVELAAQEWDFFLNAARESKNQLLAEIEALEEAEYGFETTDGQSANVSANINYWSNDEFEALKSEVLILERAIDNPNDLTLDDIRDAQKSLHELKQDLQELTETSKDLLIQSQLRYQIAKDFEASVAPIGWNPIESSYDGEDFRGAYHVKFTNLMNENLVASIVPQERQDGSVTNKLEVHFFENNPDERLRMERLNNIYESLRSQGNDLTRFTCADNSHPVEGNRDVLDFKQIKSKKLSHKPVLKSRTQ